MNIGLVLPNTPGYSETFFLNKIKGLQRNGYKVTLFVNSYENKVGIDVKIKTAQKLSGNLILVFINGSICLIKTIVFHFSKAKKLFQLNKQDNISFFKNIKNIILNSHLLSEKLDWLHFGFGTMALNRENVAKAIGAKMAVSFRGYDHYVYPVKNKNCYQLLFSKEVKYHVLSDGMKANLVKNSIPSLAIKKITPAIDANLFNSKAKFNTVDCFTIVTISRLHWIKGIENTLEALAIVKKQGVNFCYTIIGDGVELERLKFACYQLGLHENVTFTGKLSPENVKEQLQQSDLYIQYSHQEGFCNAVLEAQAMGKICIVSDAEGLSENVINKVTGFVVAKRNPVSLAEKIIETYNLSQPEKEKISINAIERVKMQFNIDKQIQEFIKFYE